MHSFQCPRFYLLGFAFAAIGLGLLVGCGKATTALSAESQTAGQDATEGPEAKDAVAGERSREPQGDQPAATDKQPQARPMDDHPFPRRSPAPALEGGVGWINAAQPVELKELRGKFVLLDFWTYC